MEDGKRIARIILNILVPTAGILLVCLLVPRLLSFFMPFVIGWIIAMIANPLVRFLEKRLKIVRRHSSVFIVVLVLAAVIGLLYLAGSFLLREVAGLIRDLPGILEDSREEIVHALAGLSRLLEVLPDSIQSSAEEWFARFDENLVGALGSLVQGIAFPTVTAAGNVARSIPTVLVYTIVMIMSAYFFIVENDRILAGLRRALPDGVWDYLDFLKRDMVKLIGDYFLAQLRIMLVVAAALSLGFLVLRVRHSVLLAVLTALLDFLPVFGTGTVLFPWALVKLLTGEWAFALGLIFLYFVTQMLRQIIQPKIVGDSMGLSPLATLFLMFLGFRVGGFSGMILAVPLGIVVLNLYRYGVFDSLIENVKLLAEEIQLFRKGER